MNKSPSKLLAEWPRPEKEAEDNDLMNPSPFRDRHKPVRRRTEKPARTPEQVWRILENVPAEFRCLVICVALMAFG